MAEEENVKSRSAPASGQSALLTYNRLMGGRLYLHTWIRLFVALTIVVGALFAKYLVGIEDLDVPALIVLAVIIAAYNAEAWFLTRSYRSPERASEAYRYLLAIMYVAIVLDFLSLTVAVWLVGGARSPFVAFYLLHVIISGIMLSPRAARVLTVLAYCLLLMLVLGETTGWIPPRLPQGAIDGGGHLDGRYALTVLVVYGMLFGLTSFLLVGLSGLLRQGERQLREANVELDRLSQIRRDFLHITLHDVKSPVGAITGLLQNLRSGLRGELTQAQAEWVDRSLKRLDGLSEFLAGLQALASLETGSLDAETEDLDLADLLREVVDENQDLAHARSHSLDLELENELPQVRGIRHLLKQAVANLVTNAVKYTPEGGKITVRGRALPSVVRIEVQDNGIGISEEDQKRLFDEFSRVKRSSKLSKAPGSGLGLSIVRRIVERHGGRALVESAVDKGSTFIIDLPIPGAAESKTLVRPRHFSRAPRGDEE